MTSVNNKEQLVETCKRLSEKFLDRWQPSTSRTCFVLPIHPESVSICSYWDSNNLKNISIYTVDDNGSIGDNIVVNERDEASLYSVLLTFYQEISERVINNKVLKINKQLMDLE